MNYHNLYKAIIDRAKGRGLKKEKLDFYSEAHHIIPECIGGPDTPENKVLLSAREHYMTHWILTKIYPNSNGLYLAYWSFYTSGSPKGIRLNSIGYSIAKEKASKILSEKMRIYWADPINKESHSKGIKRQANTDETRKKKSDATKALFKNSEYVKNHLEAMNSPKVRLKISLNSKSVWSSQEKRNKLSESVKEWWGEEERLEASLRAKETWQNPESVKKLSDSVKKAFTDPKVKEHHSKALKKAFRKGKHWENYNTLYHLWIKLNKPGDKAFKKVIIPMGYDNISYTRLINQFKEDCYGINNS